MESEEKTIPIEKEVYLKLEQKAAKLKMSPDQYATKLILKQLSQIETVEHALTIKLPKKFDQYLQKLAEALKRSVESMLLEELYCTCEQWFTSGTDDGWQDLIKHEHLGYGSLEKTLEDEVKQISDVVLDC